MDGQKNTSNNVGLITVLVILVLVIVGLVVGIVLVKNNTGGGEEPQEEEVWTDSTEMTEEEKMKHDQFIATYNEIAKKAEELYSHESVSAEEIMNLYTPTIKAYLDKGDFADAQTFILLRNENLIDRNYKKEALDALTSIDYSIFPEVMQNRYYNRIIKLASELNETDVVNKYQVLADKTKAAAEEASKASAEWAEKMQIQETEEGQ
ncbi:hypothetical protein IKF32_01700 [Candidatus Saccharibacteria bacterium]|nr:hypothetical protein [Candidatus Saccharibacteria bacterium]